MKGKLIFLLIIITLGAVVCCDQYRLRALRIEKENVELESEKKDKRIKDLENINELYEEAKEENESFRELLYGDTTDNLDVIPSDYILDELRAD